MQVELNGIVALVGAYGSGKTEIAINLAVHMHTRGTSVRVADLDLVNPYFRTREARHTLNRLGIDVVLPPPEYMQADLPILSPAVLGMLRNPTGLTLLDVGGDAVGATVLAALGEPLRAKSVQILQVINPHRPHTDTVGGCLRIRGEIEARARITVTGIVGNTNLMEETTARDIVAGWGFSKQVAAAANLPLVFITAPATLLTRLTKPDIECPVLPLKRQLVPPWKQADVF